MNREEARQYIIMRSKDYLQRDRGRQGYVCPICHDGDGVHGDNGITTKDGVHFTCWGGSCFTNADIIDIIGMENGLTDYNDKLQAAARAFNITVDSYHKSTAVEDFAEPGEYQKQAESKRYTQDNIHNSAYTTQQQPEEEEPDYTDFFLQAAQDIDKTDYHRGLSSKTLDHFNIGYVESWRHPKAPKMVASPRLIIPTSKHSYLARYAGEGDFINFRGKVENKSKVGKVRIFNPQAVQQSVQPIFIVEGEIDAMSIYEVGGEALGMGSKGNVRQLVALLESHRPSKPLILALDNEKDPEKKAKVEQSVNQIIAELERLGIPYYRENITDQHKDANEALNADREAFSVAVYGAIERVEIAEAEALEAQREELRREAVAYSLPGFLKDIENSKKASFIPTGFSSLDSLLDGGLYAGLYVVGAISSLGKTSLCLQIGDQVAASGHDVIIFSLEMARNELIAKSVSRMTLINDLAENGSTANAKTTRGILTGTRYASYSQKERELIQKSIASYAEYAKNLYIVEGVGDVGIEEIREKVQTHIKLTGKAPVLIIDYLQIIAPADMRATDKQNTDKAVLELKRLSRDYGIPVIGISSFNRDNYTAPVNLASFKESGAIEYSSDVLIGLQYEGMDYREGEADKAREKRIRELMKDAVETGKAGKPQKIQVKVLKHRNGSKGDALLDFYPMFNYFTDKVAEDGESGSGWSKSESGYSSSMRPRKGKREAEREALAKAFYEVQGDDFTANLTDLADALDKSKKQVQNLIAEYGGYSITGETVRLTKEDREFTEPGDQEIIPF